ncbi:DUF6366 family protein [Bacillus sp. 1P06AnD]|uniref:DUF6366 family protein n=1 Tax=Bacillus sp. 1P06AnD TaxID=3132208 RepID=UPI0039A3A2B7
MKKKSVYIRCNLKDGMNRAQNGDFTNLFGGLGWKGTGIVIVALIVGYIVYTFIL